MEGKASIWDPVSPGVLIFDTREDAYAELRISLSSAGVKVHAAATIPQAFILFGRHDPRAVIIGAEGIGSKADGPINYPPHDVSHGQRSPDVRPQISADHGDGAGNEASTGAHEDTGSATEGGTAGAWQDVVLAIREYSSTPVLVVSSASHTVTSAGILRPHIDEVHRFPYPTPDQSYVLRSLVQASRLARRAEPRLTVGDLVLDTEAFTLSAGNQRIPITVREFEVMRLLMSSPGRVKSFEDITAAVWGDTSGAPRISVIKVHIGRLRKKLPDTVALTTVRARGYVLEPGALTPITPSASP